MPVVDKFDAAVHHAALASLMVWVESEHLEHWQTQGVKGHCNLVAADTESQPSVPQPRAAQIDVLQHD